MAKAKVAVTIDSRILEELDALIVADRFPNRSQAIEAALADKLSRLKHTRSARFVPFRWRRSGNGWLVPPRRS